MRHAVAEPRVPTMSSLLALDAATDAGTCGHKAATLALLRNLGFDVPDGFVIPPASRRRMPLISPNRCPPSQPVPC